MPDATRWKEQAAMLRYSARRQPDPVEHRTLLTLAEDCEAIAAEMETTAQQPGKPKPPGNPPPPSRERPPPITEPPRPIPMPPTEPPPAPISARKLPR